MHVHLSTTTRTPAASASHHTAQQVINQLSAIIAYVDNDEICHYVNSAYEKWFGQPRRKVLGHPLAELLGAGYLRMQTHIARALAGEAVCHEGQLRLDGQRRRIIALYTPDLGADGVVYGFTLMAVDITEHRQGSLYLHDQERQLRRITDTIPVFIAQCDKNYRVRFVNKSYANRFGLHPEEMVGKRLADIVGADAFNHFRRQVDDALAGRALDNEIRVPFQLGEHDMHMTYVPECDEHGNVNGLIAAFSDVTRQRRTEEQLHRREQEFKTLVENSPDVISRIDRNLRHLYVNPAIEHAFGLKAASYIGKTKAELGLPADMVRAWENAASAAFSSGQEQRFNFEFDHASEPHYFSVRLVPEADRDGRIESVLSITYDVTTQTKLEHERETLLARERSSRIQAETAARARDEFLAIVSHELRAPLNGIQSWAHILESQLQDATATPLGQRAIKGIKTGIAQQVRLIEDLLDVTRMVSGKLRLVKQPLAMLPVVQAALESVRGTAAAKNIQLHHSYKITAEQINGDADRVQQIIWNLLSNAIKFTPAGGNVWLTVEAAGTLLRVTVRDNGIGISPEFLPRLFDRFSQEDTSNTRGHSGLGLGLFLVRHLVEMHGGRVEAENTGNGASFSIYLPLASEREGALASSADTDVAPMPLPSLQGARILLIDDQQDARDAISLVLGSAGASVFAAASAQEATSWLQSVALNDFPDVLICDIAMPGEDGYAALRKIRSWKSNQDFAPLQRLPALALTAFSQREDRMRALTAGFQMHMTKPVVPEELIVVIATMTQHT